MRQYLTFLACIMLLLGCARLEVPRQDVYPFRAEFVASGVIRDTGMNTSGAVYLTSCETGIIQTYLPGGMPAYTIDIQADRLVIKDIWGREKDRVDLPINGFAGLIAGDMPSQRYLYTTRVAGGMKVFYPWGVLFVDNATLPREIHVSGEIPLDLVFKPKGNNVTMEVNYGKEGMTILFKVMQGGRWSSS